MTKFASGEWGAPTVSEPLNGEQIESKAQGLLSQMTLGEKVGQMCGDGKFWKDAFPMLKAYNFRPIPGGENRRLGIPAIRFSDGPRGVAMNHSTCFPVPMARGAAWDIELEERIGDAIGVECRAQGANFFGGVCINVLRHPAWGRAQETYGEDPFHLGELGAALVRGVQRHVMCCAKHYAANSMENARFKVDVRLSERALREVYLPHFKRCVDEGVASIMSAYNRLNGEYCGHNRRLLREILKEEWKFPGFVISDFIWGVREGRAGALAGLDLEMPFAMHYGRLARLVKRGLVPEAVIDEAVLRLLRQKIRFAQVGEPERYRTEAVAGEAHRALARESAVKSMVLLKNEPVPGGGPLLPIDWGATRRIALLGRLAAQPNTGDKHGSSNVREPEAITPLEGLKAALGSGTEIVHQDGRQVQAAVEAARAADLAIVVAGFTDKDEGEFTGFLWIKMGGDRTRLSLAPADEALIRSVVGANPRTVVVLMGGGAILTEAWRDRVPAILMAWYPGMEGGHALADLLLGRAVPGGKLPCVFPCSEQQLPFFDRDARSIEYGLFHGYRLMDRHGDLPAFPFGFGLSYTTFRVDKLRLDRERVAAGESVRIGVEVTNSGPVAGDEVVQLYTGYPESRVERPVKELKGFARVHLEPGETVPVVFRLPANSLAYYDEVRRGWIVEPVAHTVYAGTSSASADLHQARLRVV